MTKPYNEHTVEDLFLFAVNSGELYERHKSLASRECGLDMWIRHIRFIVEPLYERQCSKLTNWNGSTVREAATRLKSYYEEHKHDI
jgi:hypothetical protein